jgi:hypothetical protein
LNAWKAKFQIIYTLVKNQVCTGAHLIFGFCIASRTLLSIELIQCNFMCTCFSSFYIS